MQAVLIELNRTFYLVGAAFAYLPVVSIAEFLI
jgi:hypothetical protein